MNTPGSVFRILRSLAGCALLLLILLRVDTSSAAGVNAPAVSTTGTYTVTFGTCSIYCLLEEKQGAGGTFGYVAGAYGPWPSNAGPGYGQYDATGKQGGVYYYRVGDLYTDFYSYAYYVYSNEVSVIVATSPPPPADPVSNQSLYNYETRQGDINGDGLPDLLVRRTSGGSPGNGVIENLILQRLSNGSFTQVVPSASQLSVAQGWPAIAVDLVLSDFNLDGYIDIFLNDLGNWFSGAVGQVVVSLGQPSVQGALALIPMDSRFTKFANEIGNFVENPSWYSQNAPVYQVPIYQLVPYCYYWYNEAGQVEYYCDYYYVFVGYAYVQDYSGFDQDGLAIASAFHIGGNGQMSPDLTPGSADGKAVDAAFRRVFNIPTLRGVLDTGCGGPVLSYDGETQPPCSADNIGQFILIRFATYTERGSCRYLTAGEKNGATGEGLQIIGVNKVRVCHKGFTIFGNGQVMSPNGNVYVGPSNEVVTWSEDYSVSSTPDFGTLIHELTHVFQTRTRGCHLICMAWKKIQAGNSAASYTYMPLPSSTPYYSYNIEQQAEMVEDRFLLKRGYPPFGGLNQLATVSLLNDKIPF